MKETLSGAAVAAALRPATAQYILERSMEHSAERSHTLPNAFTL